MTGRMLYLHALTPVHAGTGQTVAVIDLPVAREKATNWPLIPASSLKGVFRDAMLGADNQPWVDQAFGKEEAAGELCFGDQRLLCLPVRSYYGTFAYVTCPLALTRLRRDARALGLSAPFDQEPAAGGAAEVAVAPGNKLAYNEKVYLEDLDLAVRSDAAVSAVAAGLGGLLFTEPLEQAAFAARLAVVHDDTFTFLCETATEVSARVRLQGDTKTVAKGGLWYEEAVPAEAVFVGPLLIQRPAAHGLAGALDGWNDTVIQLGGDASTGRGLCRVRMTR